MARLIKPNLVQSVNLPSNKAVFASRALREDNSIALMSHDGTSGPLGSKHKRCQESNPAALETVFAGMLHGITANTAVIDG